MKTQLSREEKRLVERQFIAREESRLKRKRFFHVVFCAGIAAALIATGLPALMGKTVITLLAVAVWSVCVLLYTEFLTVPRTFSQDLDPWWHLNPWSEALHRVSADDRWLPAILLLISLPVLRMVFLFIAQALR